jgi:hypothetical protein
MSVDILKMRRRPGELIALDVSYNLWLAHRDKARPMCKKSDGLCMMKQMWIMIRRQEKLKCKFFNDRDQTRELIGFP